VDIRRVARELPGREELRARARGLAVLDAVICPEWERRYYSYDSKWGEEEELASMRTGSGDESSIVFGPAGVYIRFFSSDSPFNPYSHGPAEKVLQQIPEVFGEYVSEPAFYGEGFPLVTAAAWRIIDQASWAFAPDGDLVEARDVGDIIALLLATNGPEEYIRYAEEIHEATLDPVVVAAVYNGESMSEEMVRSLNSGASMESLAEDIEEIGYPMH